MNETLQTFYKLQVFSSFHLNKNIFTLHLYFFHTQPGNFPHMPQLVYYVLFEKEEKLYWMLIVYLCRVLTRKQGNLQFL